ncbi:threonylcarbamoyl-AMP synthase [Candidatus Berkelbacteria bacterium CG10_big_fil_rev_8_21_14_0_10_43_13]|uniref:L-threonylcarbamoyladenylate synthase n=1 Tax=Candidatus Berkelbacteria bacterium CG10_big_fil_rev_8_21_14_0_10_43_13 TaxID=1974514 RepID=A0A2H0W8C4_9BACT|nr:MAG: threonylcarbamoyl-AMP synthase [Candidatus Berkelbacteria bacterium CG10_big_fil_rev_8_21_14_0_10_43_13]
MNIKKLTPQNFEQVVTEAVNIIKSGGLVIAPFDTVYGIICDPKNDEAVKKIFDLKKRPLDKTIGLAVTSIPALELIAENTHPDFIKSHIFGPYTFILKSKKNNGISKYCQKEGTVAVRIPNSELILTIAKKSDYILAQTSANLTGKPTSASVEEITAQFEPKVLDAIGLIIDGGNIKNPSPSQIFDLTGDKPIEIAR